MICCLAVGAAVVAAGGLAATRRPEETQTVVSLTEAAELSGLPPDDIRHYEAEGVIPRAERGESGRRIFGAEEVRRLRLIRRVRDLGIPIQDIKRLLWGHRGDKHE